MKSIKELGLELIELQDEVLLVDVNAKLVKGNWHIEKGQIINQFPDYLTDLNDCKKIITSTKPREGLPLLVIEDEVDENVKNRNFHKQIMNPYPVQDYSYTAYEKGFREGYDKSTEFHNKAKETYKFTEEQMREMFEYGKQFESDSFGSKYFEEKLKSLSQKELHIETENYCGSPLTTDRCPKCVDICDRAYHRPKIEENKIKAVWK